MENKTSYPQNNCCYKIKRRWKCFKNCFSDFFSNGVLWLIIFALISAAVLYFNETEWNVPLVSSICASIISGVIVTLTINLRAQFNDMRDLIIDSFSDNKYLYKLSEEKLQELRERALEILKKKEYPNMQKGLVQKEQKVFDAIVNPYYEIFRENSVYYKKETFSWDGESPAEPILKRTTTVQYTLKSPKDKRDSVTAELTMSKSIFVKDPSSCNDSVIKRVFNIKHFYVSIDGGERIDIAQNLKFNHKQLDDICEYYNMGISLEYNGTHSGFKNSDNNKSGIFVIFREAVVVEVDYDIYLPVADNHFTSRIKYPAKSFRLDCICKDDTKVQFYGELLGAFTKGDSIQVTHASSNIFSIEATDWLLPRNGVFVVLCEKFEQKNNKI